MENTIDKKSFITTEDEKRKLLRSVEQDLLCEEMLLFSRYDHYVSEIIEALTSSRSDSEKLYEAKKSELLNKQVISSYHEALELARRIMICFSYLKRLAGEDGRKGMELIAGFLPVYDNIFCWDDLESLEVLNDSCRVIFEQFERYAARLDDRDFTLVCLSGIAEDVSDYVLSALVETVENILSKKQTLVFAKVLFEKARKEYRIGLRAKLALCAGELARFCGDGELSEEIEKFYGGVRDLPALMYSIKNEFSKKNYTVVISFLEQVDDEKLSSGHLHDKYTLLAGAYSALGETEKARASALFLYEMEGTDADFDMLQEILERKKFREIVEAEKGEILASSDFDENAALFLMRYTDMETLAGYIVSAQASLARYWFESGYEDLASMADGLFDAEKYLASSLIMRSIVSSILRCVKHNFLPLVSQYMARLQQAEELISDWKSLDCNSLFIENMKERYADIL